MITVKKTTYEIEGCTEPCFEVSNGHVMVRISKMYHLIGKDTLCMSSYINGEFNGRDEYIGDFDTLSEHNAITLAKEFCAL